MKKKVTKVTKNEQNKTEKTNTKCLLVNTDVLRIFFSRECYVALL